jgi:F0F1-type ATP synthase assembly protein I
MEAIARRTMRQANGYAWMYENMATSAKRWGDDLNIASGVLGGIVGTSGIVSIATDSSTPLWARIVQVVLGFLVTIVTVLTATWRLSETQRNDVFTQVSYATLAKSLMWQLAQPRKDRQDAREYVRAKLGEIEQLKISAPTIDTRTRHAYNSKFKNNPIFTPEDQWDAMIADVPFGRSQNPDNPSDDSELSAGAAEPVTPDDSDQSSLEDDLAQADAGPVATRAEALNSAQLIGALIAAYDAAQSRQNITVEIEEVDDDYSAPAAPARHKHKKKSKKKVPDGTGGD